MRLGWIISCGLEEISAFLRIEEIADIADCPPQGVYGSNCSRSEMGLELGEGHFDRVEIGAISWQEQYPRTPFFDRLFGGGTFVGGKIVQRERSSSRE